MRTYSKGSALLVVLIVMMAAITIFSIMSGTIVLHIRTIGGYERASKAFYFAEAGLEEAKTILISDPYWFTDNAGVERSLDGGTYIMIRLSGQNSIVSEGHYGGAKAVLKAEYREKPFKLTSFSVL
jgi:hypothetical protein